MTTGAASKDCFPLTTHDSAHLGAAQDKATQVACLLLTDQRVGSEFVGWWVLWEPQCPGQEQRCHCHCFCCCCCHSCLVQSTCCQPCPPACLDEGRGTMGSVALHADQQTFHLRHFPELANGALPRLFAEQLPATVITSLSPFFKESKGFLLRS